MSDIQGSEQSFVSHLVELRSRLLYAVAGVFGVFLLLFPFANELYTFVAGPLMAVLPEGTSMIATQVASPFLTPFKLSLVAALFLAMPLVLYQFWAFVAPGLYQHEKRLAMPLLASSIILFYCGMAFAYFVVFPLIFAFLTGVAPEGVAIMTDISAYLSFVLTLFFAFGVAFEVPIATILLVSTRMVTAKELGQKRPYVIVSAFVIGMLLTPPDVISQTLLALPMWLLFEIGIIFSRYFVSDKTDDTEKENSDEPTDPEPNNPNSSPEPPTSPDSQANQEETAQDNEAFQPLSEDEMEDELDRLDEEDDEEDREDTPVEKETAEIIPEYEEVEPIVDPMDQKIQWANEFRDKFDIQSARTLLYDVLVEGNPEQIRTAKNILAQLDDLE